MADLQSQNLAHKVLSFLCDMLQQSQLQYRHGRRQITPASKPLHIRQQLPDGFDHHGGKLSKHRPVEEGNDLSVLFALLLHHMENEGYMARMPKKPRVANSVDDFHSQYWEKFMRGVDSPWASLTSQQKSRHVRSWLFRKFTMDPHGRCMLPQRGKKQKSRNEAGWKGFTLTDAELDQLVQSVMRDYFQAAS